MTSEIPLFKMTIVGPLPWGSSGHHESWEPREPLPLKSILTDNALATPPPSTLTRRQCLRIAAGLGLAGLAGVSIASEEAGASRQPLRIGCSARSFHKLLPTLDRDGKLSVKEYIRLCRRWGCDCIELQDVTLRSLDSEYLVSLKREAFLQSVELSAVSVYTNFIRTRSADRSKEIDRVGQWIDRVALLGAPLLVVFPGRKNNAVSTNKAIELVSDGLAALSERAAERGVMLAIENHGMLVGDASEIVRVVDRVASPWVGANLDTGNFASDPYKNISALAPRAMNCHLKMDVHKGNQREAADLPRKFRLLQESGYAGRVALQYELPGDPMKEVPKCLAQMHASATRVSLDTLPRKTIQ